MLGAGCAVRDGEVACFGWNDPQTIGPVDAATVATLQPVEVTVDGLPDGVGALQIQWDVDLTAFCGLVVDAAYCWERSYVPGPIDGGPFRVASFVPEVLSRGVVALGNTCAMVERGVAGATVQEVWCWAYGDHGKIAAPVDAPLLVLCAVAGLPASGLPYGDRCFGPSPYGPVIVP